MAFRTRIHSKKHAPRRLRAESLENRRVLAAAVGLTDDGALTIEGDAENNRVSVVASRDGETIRVVADGERFQFESEDVRTINVRLGDGNDSVRVFRNVDKPTRIGGGAGNDRILAGSGPTFVNGGEGNDSIRGGQGRNILLGGAGRDRISGGRGIDLIIGGAGHDLLRGGRGNDWVFGDGVNEWNEDLAELELNELAREIADVNAGNDRIMGGRGNDNIFAGNGRDRAYGGLGDDFVSGGAGNDRVSGDHGDDTVVGDAGEDLIRGGLGVDVLRARDGEADVVLADSSDELIVDPELDIVRIRDTSPPDPESVDATIGTLA